MSTTEAQWSEREINVLAAVADAMNCEPYNTPPEKHAKALAAVRADRVEVDADVQGYYAIVGSQGTIRQAKDGHCSCEYGTNHPDDAYGCYHAVAAEMYHRWTQAMTKVPAVVHGFDTAPLPRLALPMRSISAIVADLSKPLPKGCVATKEQGGRKIEFLHWQTVSRILDTYAPGWNGEVTKIQTVPDPKGITGDKVVMTYRITIPAAEGLVTREATGQEDVEMVEEYTDRKSGEVKTRQAYGDSTSNAEAMAFKRAAAKFGVGSGLYDKDDTAEALDAHLKAERVRILAELGKVVDEAGFERKAVITWLQKQTGAQSNATIPLYAMQALISHLSGQRATP